MKIVTNLLLVAAIFLGSLFFKSCDEGYRINTQEMMDEEQQLIEDYLEIAQDTLEDSSVSVIDSMEERGYMFFELEEGDKDLPVEAGKEVGFRYTYYEIVRDTADNAALYPYQSNRGEDDPTIYTVGAPSAYEGVYEGIDVGIRHMNFGSKARMIVSSSLWGNDYTPRVVDLEVTYIEK
ncbi:MAG: hypothetical protein ACOC1E_01165 [Marinilabiliaceae bacterium]